MNQTLNYEISIDNLEKINPLFSKADIKVLYTGLNRNNSSISKESVESALPSMFNIPIVGHYLEESDNFGGHGTGIEITDGKIKFIQKTKPYGVVPESAELEWFTENDKEWLRVKGCYLWTGRYPELEMMLEEPFGQSMEIVVNQSKFEKIDNKDVMLIEDFTFSGLCILGVDKNGSGHVEPCFEGADVVAYEFSKDTFRKDFELMLHEIKEFTSKGDGQMTEDQLKQLFEFIGAENFDEFKSEIESLDKEEFDNKYFAVNTVIETIEEVVEEVQEFALTLNQLSDQARIELSKHTRVDRWGDTCRKFWFVDMDENRIIAEDIEEGYQLKAINYSVNGDAIVLDIESQRKVKVEYVDFVEGASFELGSKERFAHELEQELKHAKEEITTELTKEFEVNKNEFELEKGKLEAELKNAQTLTQELSEFKLSVERQAKEELINKFETLGEEILQGFKEKMDEFSLEQLDEKLSATAFKQGQQFTSKKKKQNSLHDLLVSYTAVSTGSKDDSWKDLVKSYKENQ